MPVGSKGCPSPQDLCRSVTALLCSQKKQDKMPRWERGTLEEQLKVLRYQSDANGAVRPDGRVRGPTQRQEPSASSGPGTRSMGSPGSLISEETFWPPPSLWLLPPHPGHAPLLGDVSPAPPPREHVAKYGEQSSLGAGTDWGMGQPLAGILDR